MTGVYTVSAVWEPIAAGTIIDRKRWPAHVTLASNFVVEVPDEDVVLAVGAADIAGEPLAVEFDGEDLFGPNRDVPVVRIASDQVTAVHTRLADELQRLGGFSAQVAAHWRDGYVPHVTLGAGVPAYLPSELRAVILSRLERANATVVAAWDLPSPRPPPNDLSTD